MMLRFTSFNFLEREAVSKDAESNAMEVLMPKSRLTYFFRARMSDCPGAVFVHDLLSLPWLAKPCGLELI